MGQDGAGNMRNDFIGDSGNVVQASVVHGGVHVHGPAPAGLPVPRQLPPDPTTFVDRSAELDSVDAVLSLRPDGGLSRPAVVLVTGTAGVGKTALAVRWAHRVRPRFPDGQLYANLRGYDPRPLVQAEEIVDGFLRALGVAPELIPTGTEAMVGLYRSLLDGRRVLVMLDNVRHAEQVRPLLPPSVGSLTVVTSRSRLSGLVVRDGAIPTALAPLRPADAVTLFRTIAGAVAPESEVPTTSVLVRRCAYLPLAIRIAAEQAVMRVGVDLADLAEELAVERDRLSAFATDDDDEVTEVRNVLSWSYGALTPEAARMFRLIGLHVGPDISVPTASALAGVPVAEARRALRSLAAVNMLEETARERYRFHDLLRAYAMERVEAEESEPDRATAMRRELMWYLHAADAADRVFAPRRRHVQLGPPGPGWSPSVFEQYDDAIAWCDVERPNLLAAVDQAVAVGADDVAWKLPVALVTYFYLRRHRTNRLTTTLVAVDAARRAADRYGQAWSLICVGGALEDLRRFDEAIDSYQQSLAICREITDRQGEGMSLENLASSHREIGREAEALEFGQRALVIWREIDDRRNEGITLCTLGDVSFDLGQLSAAADFYGQALPVSHETDRHSEGGVLHGLGNVQQKLRNLPEAIAYYERALLLRREIGDTFGEAESSHQLGQALRQADQPAAARRALAEALAIFDNLADPAADEVRQQLDELGPDASEPDPPSL